MELHDIVEEIRTNPTVPIWPHVGAVLRLSRGTTYAAVSRGDIEVIRIRRVLRAVTAPLRKRLGIDGHPVRHETDDRQLDLAR